MDFLLPYTPAWLHPYLPYLLVWGAVTIPGVLLGWLGVFPKAGLPRWAALVPVYNVYCAFAQVNYTFYGVRFASEASAQGPSIAFGRTNYAACGGTIGKGSEAAPGDSFYGQYEGIYYNRSKTKMVTITVK